MNKKFKIYAIVWAALLAIFNVICFVIPSTVGDYIKYDVTFWVGYISITLAFIIQLGCAFYAFKADTLQKTFYGVSVIKVSYTGLIVMLVFATLVMLVPGMPAWIAAIVCAIVVAFTIIAIVKATAAVEAITKVDTQIKTQTFFIKSLTVDADTLVASAKSEAVKAECKKFYEAVRYSDPMSNEALAGDEAQISIKFAELTEAVNADDAELVASKVNEVLILLNARNKKCKMLK